ncbi:hypothetical protein E2C01_010778 [Portunus trituberculatus]|uniref:Uncharacterized protein n=1 Tax=Portunus trituberculatus TaxID=210409 RepID=A0A5B7D9A8_PORTR|nr:hypothetical protein [Portunus trituberculatus]
MFYEGKEKRRGREGKGREGTGREGTGGDETGEDEQGWENARPRKDVALTGGEPLTVALPCSYSGFS